MIDTCSELYGINFYDDNGHCFCKIDEVGIWLNYDVYDAPAIFCDLLYERFETLWYESSDCANLDKQVHMMMYGEIVCLIDRNEIWFSDDLTQPDFVTRRSISLLQNRWKESIRV